MRTFQCQLVVDSATHLPHPRSGDSTAAWSATAYSLSTTATHWCSLISQLTSISRGHSPIRHLWTRLVASSLSPNKIED